MTARRSLLEVGDEFIFAGLTNEVLDANYERHMILIGISVGGDVQYRLEIVEDGETTSKNLGSTPLPVVHLLIEEGVWLMPNDFETKKRMGRLKFA